MGISAAVKSPMLTSDRVQYKCTRNAVMAKKQVAKFLVDFNFVDYEIIQVSSGNDYDRHIPQINLVFILMYNIYSVHNPNGSYKRANKNLK